MLTKLSLVYTEPNDDDFYFHHNIIANCKRHGYGNSTASVNTGPTTNVITTGTIQNEMDQSKRNYLQLAEGSLGTDLGAGLFK